MEASRQVVNKVAAYMSTPKGKDYSQSNCLKKKKPDNVILDFAPLHNDMKHFNNRTLDLSLLLKNCAIAIIWVKTGGGTGEGNGNPYTQTADC